MIKKVLIINLVLMLALAPSIGQVNLVQNPSFESYTSCPAGPAEIPKATGWTHNGSSDYYNMCELTNQYSVPFNIEGYQPAASGGAYAGIVTFYSASNNYREYLTHSLSSPLLPNGKYFVSFKTCLGIGTPISKSNYATDKMGAMFSTTQPSGFYQIINNNPKLYHSSVITDTVNWTRVFGSFIADSAYSYIIIGNFFDDANINKVAMYSSSPNLAYYYIDDVCVSTDSLFAGNYVYTDIQQTSKKNSFSIYPNPVINILTIENVSSTFDFSITNSLGRVLLQGKNVAEKKFSVDISFLPEGIIFLHVKSKQEILNYKLLKQ